MIECIRYTAINKSTCLGMATIHISNWKMTISGIALHQKDGKRWVNLPSRIVEENGEKKYYPYIYFDDKDTKDKFGEAVKKAIDEHAIKVAEENPQMEEEVPF